MSVVPCLLLLVSGRKDDGWISRFSSEFQTRISFAFVLEISVQSLRNLLALVNRYGSQKSEPVFRYCTIFCSP